MRLLALLLFLPILALACNEASPGDDPCARASSLLNGCGVALPLFSEGSCTAGKRALATCINANADNCDDLAALYRRPDVCLDALSDAGVDLAPPDDLGVPAPEGDASVRPHTQDAGVTAEASSPPPDSGPAASDAAPDTGPADAGAWPGLSVTGSVTLGQEKLYSTPTLSPGSYTVAIAGTGDADLYVRYGADPTTQSYDCRPFLTGSNESCPLQVTAPGALHIMVRGSSASTSTYTLVAHP
jgi:Bacterial pre-peptidase C-terminal domain